MYQLEINQDDAAHYSKRSCPRVFGVPLSNNDNEPESDYRDIARKMLSEMRVSIPEDEIDKIHRIGRECKRAGGVMEQAIIMMLSSWKLHTVVYKQRANLKCLKFLLDLTPRRASVLYMAIAVIKDNSEIDFALANINCHLTMRL